MHSLNPVAVLGLAAVITAAAVQATWAACGLPGIDHRLHEDSSPIWKRNAQAKLLDCTLTAAGAGAFAFDDGSKPSDTS